MVLSLVLCKAEVTHTLSKAHPLPCCSFPCSNDRSGTMGSTDQLPASSQSSLHRLLKKVPVLRHVCHCPGPVSHPLSEFSRKEKGNRFLSYPFHIFFIFASLSMVFPALIQVPTPFLLPHTVRGSQVFTLTSADYFSARW